MILDAFTRKRNFLVTGFLLGMSFCNLTLIYRALPALRNGYQDFTIYYTGARLLREGQSAALYDLGKQYQTQLTFTSVPIRQGPLPYNHPPFEALLFIPFTWLGYWPAYLAWTALNLMMLTASALLLRKFSKIRSLSLVQLGLGCLAFFPVMLGLMQGQDIILLLLLMIIALACLDRDKEEAAGACLAAGLFRPHVVLPLVLLFAIRQWRLLFGFIPTALVLAGISAMAVGWGWPLMYVHFILHLERIRLGNYGPQASPNLRGLIGELVAATHASWMIATVLIVVSTLAVLALTIRRIRGAHDSVAHSLCLITVAAILISFHALCYDLTLILPLALFLFTSFTTTDNRVPGEKLLLIFVLFLAPLYFYLQTVVDRFFWFGLVLLWLFFRLLRMPAPAADPA